MAYGDEKACTGTYLDNQEMMFNETPLPTKHF